MAEVSEIEKQAQAQREQFAKTFVQNYYNTFDNNRASLGELYREMSRLTFEKNMFYGHNQIQKKLVELPFSRIQHEPGTMDVQETPGGIIILVTGALLVDEEQRPMNFTQAFTISHDGEYYVHNDIFRLVFG